MSRPSPFTLQDKTVLITGASSGIGRATALLCAGMGARLFVCGRDRARLDALLAELAGEGHVAVQGDLTDPADRQALLEQLPALDGAVFSAGVAALVPMRMVSQKHIDAMFAVNYNAPVLLTQGLLAKKKIRNAASLVYVTAVAEHVSPVATGVYSGAKAALTATVRGIAGEVAKQGIRANCVSPGFVDTPMLEGLQQVTPMEKRFALSELGMIAPADIAAGIAYLLSPASRWVSRTTLLIDGGLALHVR
ncbi:MAG: SDR family oxidoreductase [Massilia sp.]